MEVCSGTDGGSHGSGWIGNSSLGIDSRVEVLWRLRNESFNPILCSGNLSEMTVNMSNCS